MIAPDAPTASIPSRMTKALIRLARKVYDFGGKSPEQCAAEKKVYSHDEGRVREDRGAAAAPQQQIAQQRDVVPGRDLPLAMGAARPRLHDGLVTRPTMNAHVEEAADEEPEQECEEDHVGELASWTER